MVIPYKNNESFSLKGYWSLSFEDTEKEVAGILRYSEEKIVLELFDDLDETTLSSNEKIRIEGVSIKNYCITLFDCHRISEQTSSIKLVDYHVGSFTIGNKFIASLKEPLFSNAILCTSNMQEWLSYELFEYSEMSTKSTMTFDRKQLKEKLYEYKIPTENIVIKESYHVLKSNSIQSGVNLQGSKFLQITSNKSLNLEAYMSISRKLISILSLLQGQYENITFIELFFDADELNENTVDERIRYYFRPLKKSRNSPVKYSNYRFYYSEIREQFQSILSLFFEKYEILSEIVQVYIGDIEKNPFVETRFLNSVRSLEIYSRNLSEVAENIDLEIEEARLLLKEVLKKNFSDNQKVLKYFSSKIDYKSETNLNARISKTIKLLTPKIKHNLIKKENKTMSKSISSFTSYLVQTRNYHTHGDSNKSKYTTLIEGNYELFIMSKKLTLIIEFLLLSEVGLDKDFITETLLRNTQYGYLFPPATESYSFADTNIVE